MLIASALISGVGLGAMYGLLALGFYITYSVSSTVNFAQGSSMMLGAVLAYTFAVTWGWPFALAAALALALCSLYGVVVEWIAVRPFARRGSNAWLMAKYPDIKSAGDVTPAVGVANAYDAMHLVAIALQNAGSLSGDEIRLGFYKIDKYDGLIKTYVKPFTPENHDAIGPQDYVWTQFIDNQILPVGMKK